MPIPATKPIFITTNRIPKEEAENGEHLVRVEGLKKNNSTWNVVPELGTDKCVVIIDSLSPLILNIGFANCYRQLHKLMRCKKVMQSVCLVHEDSMPDAHILLPQLQHLATTTIRVEPPSKNSKGNPISSLTHKKPGGRVAREVEFYRSEIDGKFTSHKLEAVKGKLEAPSDESTLPQDLTTFKLSLGSQEKQARSELVLPYVRTNEDKGGKVFYQPDAGDDWDEEDPDDDLDI
ncbi:hypothetical protein C0J52_18659 [Blattella germanica]|nr:hypothetical protein C0J52_18659 [Blattella germanica]